MLAPAILRGMKRSQISLSIALWITTLLAVALGWIAVRLQLETRLEASQQTERRLKRQLNVSQDIASLLRDKLERERARARRRLSEQNLSATQ